MVKNRDMPARPVVTLAELQEKANGYRQLQGVSFDEAQAVEALQRLGFILNEAGQVILPGAYTANGSRFVLGHLVKENGRLLFV